MRTSTPISLSRGSIISKRLSGRSNSRVLSTPSSRINTEDVGGSTQRSRTRGITMTRDEAYLLPTHEVFPGGISPLARIAIVRNYKRLQYVVRISTLFVRKREVDGCSRKQSTRKIINKKPLCGERSQPRFVPVKVKDRPQIIKSQQEIIPKDLGSGGKS